MNFLKKSFFIIIAIFLVVILLSTLLIVSVRSGSLDIQSKKLIEYYLDKKSIKIIIGDLHIKNNKLSIDKIVLDLDDKAIGEITNFRINFSLKNILSKSTILSAVTVERFSIISKDNENIVDVKIATNHKMDIWKNKISTNIYFDSITSSLLSDNQGSILPNGSGFCNYESKLLTNSKKSIDCDLNFGNNVSLNINGFLKKNLVKLEGNITNIPIMIYRIAQKIIPNNEVLLYLQESIKAGIIQNGEFMLDLDLNKDLKANALLSEKVLTAKFQINNMEFKYDKDFPALKNIDSNILISGTKVKFLINKAKISNSLISNSIVTFEWLGVDKSNFVIEAVAKGPVVDLIDFVSAENYKNSKDKGIDLKKLNGIAETVLKINIPIRYDAKNIYDISTTLSNIKFEIFDKQIILRDSNILGTFDGYKLNFKGTGKINNFLSNFIYQYNIVDNNKENYQALLKVDMNITASKQKLGLLKLLSGNNVLNFEYKNLKNNQATFNINSELNNLEFYLDKVSIHKPPNKKATLQIKGHVDQNSVTNVDFSLIGEDRLQLTGKMLLKNGKYNITFPIIRHLETNISSTIITDKDFVIAELKGSRLDLSRSNMLQFLEKEGENKNIHLTVNVGTVKLKNNIFVDNLQLTIDCDKVKCFTGFLDAKIGSKPLTMKLVAHDNKEKWLISCGNAGALFKAIGMYNNMKAGTANLVLETQRHEVKKGEIIPILDGTFQFKRFVASDISFFTRIVSFVSLPGFMSFIINNKDIMFEDMSGKFSYIGNVVTIAESSATGPFLDFTMKGSIDTKTQQINLKGNVIPSFFMLGTVITKIPLVGKIFSKMAPYSITVKYNEE